MDNPADGLLNGRSINSLAADSGIPYASLHRKLRDNPLAFTMGELLRIAEALGKTPAEVITALDPAQRSAA